MNIPRDLLDRLDLGAAIQSEVDDQPDRLPSAVAETTLGKHVEEYEAFLETRLRKNTEISLHEVIWVPKAPARFRSVSALPLDDRLLYRALVLDVQNELDEPLSIPHKTEFEQMVLDEAPHPYFVRADVAAYYNYVDHSVVHDRIIEEAARADTADLMVELLGSVMGRSFGIPQNVGASDIIGELVLQPVADRMDREGIRTFRRNDDFYIPVQTWDEGISVVEALQSELNVLGLTLNEEKTRIWKRDTLERNIGRVLERLRELLAERTLGYQVADIDPYTGEPLDDETEEDSVAGEPPSAEDVAQAATTLLQESLDVWLGSVPEPAPTVGSGDRAVARSAVDAAIRLLGRIGSPAGLEHGIQILSADPGATQAYALDYLTRLPSSAAVPEHIEELLGEIGKQAPAWQQVWLMDPLLNLQNKPTLGLIDWLHEFLQSRHPSTLRVRALLVLGLHDLMEPTDISAHFDSVPTVARPDVAAAVALRVADSDDAVLRPIRRAGKLYDWIVDDVIDELPNTGLL